MIRRRRRWFRRTMVGLAFAVIAAPASARPFDENGNLGSADAVIVSAGGWSGAVDARTGVPLSAGIPQEDHSETIKDEGLRYESQAPVALNQRQLELLADESYGNSSVRPDDRAERFVVVGSGGVAETASSGSSFNWEGAAGIAGTAFGLALLLGIATAMRRRPHLAGS